MLSDDLRGDRTFRQPVSGFLFYEKHVYYHLFVPPMPLFIFVGGLLQKRWTKERPFRWDKPVYYIILGYLLKIGIYVIKGRFWGEAYFPCLRIQGYRGICLPWLPTW